MTITFTLPGFPDGQQRTEQTSDGQVPENGSLDCVPRSIADGLTYLTGRSYNGDELKDAVHGQGWTGFQAASEYVNYCRAAGVALTPVNGTPAALVARIHQEIAAGHPVVATIPSLWGLGRDGARAYCAEHNQAYTTHVVCFCGTGPGALRCANPWIAQWHDGDDAYWAADLEEGQIWIMSRIKEVATVAANTQGLGAGFAAYANAHNADVAIPEQFEPGFSWATLKNGAILRYDAASGVQDTRGADVLAYVQQQRRAAQNKPAPAPAPAPVDPKAQPAEAIADALGKVLDAVAAYRKL